MPTSMGRKNRRTKTGFVKVQDGVTGGNSPSQQEVDPRLLPKAVPSRNTPLSGPYRFWDSYEPWVWMVAGLFLLRTIHLVFMARLDPYFLKPAPGTDMEVYWQQAGSIAEGDWLMRSTAGAYYYGPLMSYFQAPLRLLFGDNLWPAQWAQWLLGFFPPLILFALGSRLINPKVGFAAALLFATYGPWIYWSQTLLGESLLVLILSLALGLMLFAVAREKALPFSQPCKTQLALWIATGFLLGLAVLGRGNNLLVLAGLTLLRGLLPFGQQQTPATKPIPDWANWLKTRKASLLLAGCMVAGSLIPLGPTILRNVLVSGKFTITTNGPALLYIGNGRDAIGVLTSSPHIEALMETYEGNPPWLRELARDLAADPLHLPRILWVKTQIYFNSYDAPDNFSFDLFSRFSPIARWSPTGWSLILSLGGLGVWSLRRRLMPQGDLWPLTAILILFPLSIIPILVVGRYRLPWLLPCSILAGAGIVWLIETIRLRKSRDLLVAGVWSALIFWTQAPHRSPASEVISIPERPGRLIRPNDYAMLIRGLLLQEAGDDRIHPLIFEGAEAYPEVGFLNYSAIDLHMSAQPPRIDQAVFMLERLIRLNPGELPAIKLLARAYVQQGKGSRALRLLEQLAPQIPEDQEVQTMLRAARQRFGNGSNGLP